MLYNGRELHEEFYDKIAHSMGDREQVKEAAEFIFKQLADGMEKGELPKMRVPYLGAFQIRLRRASFFLRSNKKKFMSGKMDKKEYVKNRLMLERFITNGLGERSKKLKEKVPMELTDVLLARKEEDNRDFFFRYKKWLK